MERRNFVKKSVIVGITGPSIINLVGEQMQKLGKLIGVDVVGVS